MFMLSKIIKKALRLTHTNVFAYKLFKTFSPQKSVTTAFTYNEIQDSRHILNNVHHNIKSSSLTNNHLDLQVDLHIIIPVYNVERYIQRCIESVLTQETSYSYIVTIINDGSPDNSRELLKKYENDNKVEIIDQENKGFSGARNSGLAIIKGNYVMFVDSDDCLAPNAINSLLNAAYKNNADIVQGGYNCIDENNHHLETYPTPEIISSNNYDFLKGYPWGKVFKAYLFEKIHFPELYWYEDTICTYLLFPMSHVKVGISNIVYNYRINKNGITYKSIGNTKSIDTLYITEALLKDAFTFDFAKSYIFYRAQFRQIICNAKRIDALSNKHILKASFVLQCSLIEHYFKGYSLENESYERMELEKAIKNHDYHLYNLIIFFLI